MLREVQADSLRHRVSPQLDLSADYMEMFGGTLRSRWDRSLSAGAEFRVLPMLPLRAGMATSFEQFALTGGVGLPGQKTHWQAWL